MNNTDLKKPVMRRVYLAYTLRKLSGFPCLECAALAVLTCIAMLFMSLKNIFMNFFHLPAITDYPGYFLSSFLSTHMVDKLIVVIGVLICGKLAWETTLGAAKVGVKVSMKGVRVSMKLGGGILYFARQIV